MSTKREHLRAWLGETIAELVQKGLAKDATWGSKLLALGQSFTQDVTSDMKWVLGEFGRSFAGFGIMRANQAVKQRHPRFGKLTDALTDFVRDEIGKIGR